MKYIISINGCGLRLMSATKTQTPGIFHATLWLTFLFIPLIPLKRFTIRPIKKERFRFTYDQLESLSLDFKAILKTYLSSIGMILALLTPVILSITEIQTALGIPDSTQWILMFLAIIWLVVFIWKFLDWDEKRWFT